MSERGVYRGIYSSLPDDTDFQRLSPHARLVLYTVRVCKAAGPAAIFRYYPEVIMIQTGLSKKALRRAFEDLERGQWIEREEPILWVRNGLRYDPSIRLADRKHLKSVERALAELPRLDIVLKFCDYYKISRPFEGPSKTHLEELAKTLREGGVAREGDTAREGTRTPPSAGLAAGFERLWMLNPKKVGKAAAWAAYRTLAPEAECQACLESALAAQRTWPDRQGRYFPHLATWLHGKRWEDEPPAASLLTDRTANNLDVARRFVERMGGTA